MAKFCTECGKEIAAGMAFCTECGTKAPDDPAPQVTEAVTEVKAEPTPPAKPETPVYTPPAPAYQPQQTYAQPQPTYSSPVPDNTNKVVGTGLYIGLMILFSIPIIGFIACIIITFTAKNKNIKNYARATLICMIIAFVLLAILVALVSVLVNALNDYINQMTDGQFGGFGDLFGQVNEIKDSMNEFANVTDQINNGALGSLPLE